MSLKRTSVDSESRTDEQPSSNSDPLPQGDHVKRFKLTSVSDTTLQDLPVDLVECILVRAIAMEVEEMHLAKSVWKKKADLVISRLRTVCPDWSNILTTNFFQKELYRTLDRTAETKIRLEILQKTHLPYFEIYDAVTLKDELFVLCDPKHNLVSVINVHDRSNLAEVKDVIEMPGIRMKRMAACNVSNCLYVINFAIFDEVIVSRITKKAEHQFRISPLISNRWKPDQLSVGASGSIIVWKQEIKEQSTEIVVFGANGFMQHRMKLSLDLSLIEKLIPKANGNLVLVSTKEDPHFSTKLTEIDMNGTIIRQYQSSICVLRSVCLAHRQGRIALVEDLRRIELLDGEFSRLKGICASMDFDNDPLFRVPQLHYNTENNELVAITENFLPVVTIFRFAEE